MALSVLVPKEGPERFLTGASVISFFRLNFTWAQTLKVTSFWTSVSLLTNGDICPSQ